MQQLSTGPRTYARDEEIKKDGDGVSKTNGSLRSRARACEAFYAPAIADDADAATDYALAQTGGSGKYRGVWRFYCLAIGLNTFLDQLDIVLGCYRQGEIRFPARAFHARIRNMKARLDKTNGGAE